MISKNIYQVAINLDKFLPVIETFITNLKNLNPQYKHHLITKEEQLDIFVNENYDGDILKYYNKLNILTAKIDFYRYLVLYKNGGCYMDIDITIQKPFDTFLNKEDHALVSGSGVGGVLQSFIFFKKQHPILLKTIELVIENIKSIENSKSIYKSVHDNTGPEVLTKAFEITHNNLYNKSFNFRSKWDKDINITFEKNDVQYRLYSLDMNGARYDEIHTKISYDKWSNSEYEDWRVIEKMKTFLK